MNTSDSNVSGLAALLGDIAAAVGMALQHIRLASPHPVVDAEMEFALSALARLQALCTAQREPATPDERIAEQPSPKRAAGDGLVKDAARYQWLKAHIEVTVNRGCPSCLSFELRTDADRDQPHSLLIDQAIDIEMGEAAAPEVPRA